MDCLKDHTLSDHKLMAEVNAVVARDKENRKKMGKGKLNVNALSGGFDEGHRGRSRERGDKTSRNSSVESSVSRERPPQDQPAHKDSREPSATRVRTVSFKEEAEKSSSESAVLAIVTRLETDMREQNKTVMELQKQLADLVRSSNNNNNNGNNNNNNNNNNNGNNNGDNKKPFPRCEACEPTGAFCTHCKKCGQTGHKQWSKVCPKNK